MIAVLPAHNEANGIAAALAALGDQAMPPDRIIAVWDHCADDTANVARRARAEVRQTVGNTDTKAGALNQALSRLLPQLGDELILIQDADSVLGPELTRTAAHRITSGADAVGGVFPAKHPRSLLEHFQANEYGRHAREAGRTGRVMVLTGTGAVRNARAQQIVAGHRALVLGRASGDGSALHTCRKGSCDAVHSRTDL